MKRSRDTHRSRKEPTYEPTPDEIRDACRRIRSSWTNGDWQRRSQEDGSSAWTPPIVDITGLANGREDTTTNGTTPT